MITYPPSGHLSCVVYYFMYAVNNNTSTLYTYTMIWFIKNDNIYTQWSLVMSCCEQLLLPHRCEYTKGIILLYTV